MYHPLSRVNPNRRNPSLTHAFRGPTTVVIALTTPRFAPTSTMTAVVGREGLQPSLPGPVVVDLAPAGAMRIRARHSTLPYGQKDFSGWACR